MPLKKTVALYPLVINSSCLFYCETRLYTVMQCFFKRKNIQLQKENLLHVIYIYYMMAPQILITIIVYTLSSSFMNCLSLAIDSFLLNELRLNSYYLVVALLNVQSK